MIGGNGIQIHLYHATTQFFLWTNEIKDPYSVEFSSIHSVFNLMEDKDNSGAYSLSDDPAGGREKTNFVIGLITNPFSYGANDVCPRIPKGITEIIEVPIVTAGEENQTIKFYSITWPGLEETKRTILHFHGGGYISGRVDEFIPYLSRLSRISRSRVLSFDYGLAPENPLPKPYDEALLAYEWILQHTDSSNISMGGESAGGGLVAGVIQRAVNKGLEVPASAFMISPFVDLSVSYSKTGKDLEYVKKYSMGGDDHNNPYDVKDPLISPLFGSFEGFPASFITAARDEDNVGEIDELVRRMKLVEGLEVEVLKPEDIGLVHGWLTFCTTEGVEDTAILGHWIKKHWGNV